MRTKVEICGVDTASLPVLKHEEMKRLFERLQAGEEYVRETLVMSNLRLVLSIVGRFAYRESKQMTYFKLAVLG